MFRFRQAHGVDEHGRSFVQRGGNLGLPALGNDPSSLPLGSEVSSSANSKAPPTPFTAFADQSENDMFPPEAESLQSRRKSWQNGFGSTTVINEMVMMLPQPIEATSSWLILVSLMVCVLTATLTSYWTANTVKDMLKKFPRGELSSMQTNDNDLGTTMTYDSDLAANSDIKFNDEPTKKSKKSGKKSRK